ncbi:MAG: hypothetical protein GF309_06900 [Candidatus Lokiarchaeota archaeon]|nr:hypothetical protein [Candidatus Lokiarchaeota archaeon]
MTKPSNSLQVNYFAIAGFEPPIDELGNALTDLDYEIRTSFSSDKADLTRIVKEDSGILLHDSIGGGERYLTGIALPLASNIPQLRRSWKIYRAAAIIFVIYIGALLGVALAGLGVRGGPRPYLLEWLTDSWIPLAGVGILLLVVSYYFAFKFNQISLPDRNHAAAEMVRSDLEHVLSTICSEFEGEMLSGTEKAYTPWYDIPSILPDSAFEAFDQLIEVVEGLDKIDGTILDINQAEIPQDTLRTY